MKKTVGLITIHNSTNYGALLQAYALQQFIEDLGFDCEIINHNKFGGGHKKLENYNHNRKLSWIIPYSILLLKNAGMIRALFFNKKINNIIYCKVKNKCDLFRANCLKIGEVFFESTQHICNNPPLYDYYICGSDQIWNPMRITYSGPFYLNFVPEGRKRIAYAASIAVDTIPEALKPLYKAYLTKFNNISIREKQGCIEIGSILNKQIPSLLDPTFLLSKKRWDRIAVLPEQPEQFIFCYFLNHANICSMRKKIKEFANEKKIKVVVLLAKYKPLEKEWITLDNVGPCEFLGLISKSDTIFTDSFHGLALSIIYEKNFYIYIDEEKLPFVSRSTRLQNLLDMFNLSDRIINESCNLVCDKIDYSQVNSSVIKQIEISKEYISVALS